MKEGTVSSIEVGTGGSKVTTDSNINKAITLYAQWKEKTLPTAAPTVEPTTTPTMIPKPVATATPTSIATSTGEGKYVTKATWCHIYITALNGVKTVVRISVCNE